MVITDFQVEDQAGRPRFFQETFLVTNTKFKVILKMFFLKISNADMLFGKKTLMWMFYTTNQTLPTTEQVQIIKLKEFVIAMLDTDNKTFVMHMAIWKWEEMVIDSVKKVQIKAQSKAQSGAQVGALIFNKTSTKIPAEYSNNSDAFLAENAAKLAKYTGINEHAIKLEEGKRALFGLIYSLGPVELEILKTYIKTNLVNGFICPFKSLIGALILFDRKPNRNFCLCIDYWGLNNIIIKN